MNGRSTLSALDPAPSAEELVQQGARELLE